MNIFVVFLFLIVVHNSHIKSAHHDTNRIALFAWNEAAEQAVEEEIYLTKQFKALLPLGWSLTAKIIYQNTHNTPLIPIAGCGLLMYCNLQKNPRKTLEKILLKATLYTYCTYSAWAALNGSDEYRA